MTQELTLIERAQQALRGEVPWEPIMGRIHAFVRGDLDAEIAALTEKLRAVEAERDALIKDVLAIVPESIQPKVSGESPSWHAVAAVANLNARRLNHEADLSALRAELERKDAALKWYAEQVGQCAKFDAVPGGAEARAALAKDVGAKARAALKPKEPPCKA